MTQLRYILSDMRLLMIKLTELLMNLRTRYVGLSNDLYMYTDYTVSMVDYCCVRVNEFRHVGRRYVHTAIRCRHVVTRLSINLC